VSLTPIIRALVGAGATPEMILAAVEAHEAEQNQSVEARREKDRERKRAARASRSVRNVPRNPADNADAPPPPDKKAPHTPKELTPTPSKKTPKGVQKGSPPPFCYPDDFEAFWSAYPDKTNNSKKRAAEEWALLGEEDRALATAACGPYRAFLAKPDGPPCIHAERFLKHRRFDGYAEQAEASKPPPPVELTDSAEHRFLAQCRDDGATGWQRWARGGGFEVVKAGGDTVCVVSGPLHEFEDMGKATAKRLGVLIWNDAFYKKRLEKTA